MGEDMSAKIEAAMRDPETPQKAQALMQRIGLTEEELMSLQGSSFEEFSAALDELMRKKRNPPT